MSKDISSLKLYMKGTTLPPKVPVPPGKAINIWENVVVQHAYKIRLFSNFGVAEVKFYKRLTKVNGYYFSGSWEINSCSEPWTNFLTMSS